MLFYNILTDIGGYKNLSSFIKKMVEKKQKSPNIEEVINTLRRNNKSFTSCSFHVLAVEQENNHDNDIIMIVFDNPSKSTAKFVVTFIKIEDLRFYKETLFFWVQE